MKQNKTVGFEIRSLNNMIKRDVEASHPEILDKTTGVHAWAIRYLFDNRDKDIFQRDFEVHFSIRRSTATRILQLMEKNGLIVRQGVKSDARLKKIVLTKKAEEIHKLIMQDIKKREQRLTANISKEELDAFFNTIDKIKANLEDTND